MSLPFPSTRKRATFLSLLLFFLIGIVCYWPSFFGERIWDDHFLVGRNPFFRSPALAWEAYNHWLYPFSDSAYYRPTQNVSYMWDYWVWGEDLFGYHLTNALIHAGAAFLLGFLFRRIVRASLKKEQDSRATDLLAWGAAFLWLVHPIHHAGGAYVSGRADSLAALFSLGAWLLCERGLEARNRAGALTLYGLAGVFGWLALCSKEIALTWCGLFAIYHLFLRSDRLRWQRILPIAGAGLLVVAYAFHRIGLPRMAAVNSVSPEAVAPFGERFVLMLKALGDYVSLIFCPLNLHMERMLTPDESLLANGGSWLKFHSAIILPLGILAFLCGIWLCFGRSPDRKLYRFAVCWFLLGFLPISNLFPLNAQVAEHWIYMPSAALILLAVKGILSIPLPRPSLRPALLAGFCALMVVLTHEQSRYWVSEENFFRTTITRGGDTPRARANLARVLSGKGNRRGAEAILRKTLEQHPEISVLKTHLADFLLKSGDSKEASKIIISTAEPSNRPPIPWTLEVTQIQALLAADRRAEAQEILSRTLARWPLAWELVKLQASFHETAKRPEEAHAVLSAYVNHNWWHYDAVILLAQSLAAAGKHEEAIEKYKEAARLDIRATKPFEQIVAIRLRQKRPADALLAQAEAVNRAPDSLLQRERMALLYEMLGRREDAAIERMIFPQLRLRAQQRQVQQQQPISASTVSSVPDKAAP